MKNRVFGYCRISTQKQRLERQIDNIKAAFPNAVIITEDGVSGCTLDRPAWKKLKSNLHSGDTVVFDEVSRMSRNAQEGFELYQELYSKDIHLVFLKERHIDTDVFRERTKQRIEALSQSTGSAATDKFIQSMIDALNAYSMDIIKEQIQLAFLQAQAEVDRLHKRTSEGVRKAQAMGKQVGRATGATVETKKAKECKQIILKHSKDFGGSLNDAECLQLTGLARNTFYKYKRALKEIQ